MCLYINKKETAKFNGIKNKTYTFWKEVIGYQYNGKIIVKTPYQCMKIHGPGIIIAKGLLNIYKNQFEDHHLHAIENGALHLFRTKLFNTGCNTTSTFFLKVTVLSDDIIAANKTQICVFKFNINSKDWNKLISLIKSSKRNF